MRVGASWRKPRGIDNKARRKYRGYDILPRIGYGTQRAARHVLPNGFKKFTIQNVAELDLLLMHNRAYCAEIAHNVSQRKRAAIIERAKVLDVKVLNGAAKLRQQANE
jgi:large subunit ribosomal protein L32e